jgi:predicted nucleotidyltransferase
MPTKTTTKEPDLEAAIKEMVRRIVEKFNPEKIILFGSHARGDATPDSDVDLLVVMPVDGSRRKTATDIDLSLWGLRLPVDIMIATPREMQRYADLPGTIIRPALREGKVLHERRT